MFEEGLTLLGFLFALLATLLGAYFTTKWLGTRMLGVSGFRNTKKFAVVHRLPLGREQNISVVQVGTRYILVGCTPNSISMITELTESECLLFSQEYESEEKVNSFNFSQVFNKEKEKMEQNMENKD